MTMTKKSRPLIAAIVIALAGSVSVQAAEKGHAHKAPHGGVVQEADGVHAEFLIDKSGQPTLYLYDKSMKPLAGNDVEPRVMIKAKGQAATDETRVLKFSKEGWVFKGEPIQGLKDWDTAVVTIKLKDTPTNIRFSRGSDGHGH
jgi:hypothetical protein